MNKIKNKQNKRESITDSLIRKAGVRVTKQRRSVLEIVIKSKDHPTASMIYNRANANGTILSLATVYNCLESMSEARIINQLHFDNGSSRYCSNIVPHAHIMDNKSHSVLDIHLKEGLFFEDIFDIPDGVQICHLNAYLYGTLPDTLTSNKAKSN